MKIYEVGGAVRDASLGLPIKERDWVVVGASADDLLAQGSSASAKTSPYSCTRRPVRSTR